LPVNQVEKNSINKSNSAIKNPQIIPTRWKQITNDYTIGDKISRAR
jgi:hypothetical protein